MRVALVSDPYSPRVGGIETQVRNLGQALSNAGLDVTVITATPTGDTRGDTLELDGDVTVRRITTRVPFDLPVNPFAKQSLIDALPTFDVVHIHTGVVSPFARLAVQACIETGTRAILTWHSHLMDATWWYGFANPLPHWEQAGITLSAVSSAAAKAVEDSARGAVRVAVLPNLTFDEPWESARQDALADLRKASDSPSAQRSIRAVTATRLAPRKRVVQLARIAKRAGVDVDVYGAGALEGVLSHPEVSGGLLHLRGKVKPQELATSYANADLFVSPVIKEAFGIAALEARACGLPVIYRKGSGIEDFITHGVDGLQVDSDEEMAAALKMFASHPERLQRMRSYALTHPIQHTWDKGLSQYLDLYERSRN